MRHSLLSFIALAVLVASPVTAKADYFVWGDPETGVSLSYPDTWKMVSNADKDDVITIMAPAGRGHAACRLRARADERYMIYPPKYSRSIQHIAYSSDFWEHYLQEYTHPRIEFVLDDAGLGRGFASYAVADYESAVQGPEMDRRALMFASLYNGEAYILECSAHRDAFERWRPMFYSIAKSVDFRKAHYEIPSGNYYNFMKDPRMEFEGEEGENRVIY